ncbi:MAG: hypothetical protein ACRD4M_12720, partial [Candidatus Acidiferrales bacterium]
MLLLMTLPSRAQKTPSKKSRQAANSSRWVDATLRKMTVREKLGQMLMVYYFGVFTSAQSPEYKELLHEVDDNHVGGLILGTERG